MYSAISQDKSTYITTGHRGHPRLKDTWETAIDRTIERLLFVEKRRYITPVTVLAEAYKVFHFVLPFDKRYPYSNDPKQRQHFWSLLKTYRPYIKHQLRAFRTSQLAHKIKLVKKPIGTQQDETNKMQRAILETMRNELNLGLQ